jgi:hypothetical protein
MENRAPIEEMLGVTKFENRKRNLKFRAIDADTGKYIKFETIRFSESQDFVTRVEVGKCIADIRWCRDEAEKVTYVNHSRDIFLRKEMANYDCNTTVDEICRTAKLLLMKEECEKCAGKEDGCLCNTVRGLD